MSPRDLQLWAQRVIIATCADYDAGMASGSALVLPAFADFLAAAPAKTLGEDAGTDWVMAAPLMLHDEPLVLLRPVLA